MKIKYGIGAVGLTFILLLGACTSPETDDSTNPAPRTPDSSFLAECTGEGTGGITIYSGRKQNLIQPLIDGFQSQSGIKVTVKEGSGAELVNALIEERARPRADVFVGQDAGGLDKLGKSGVLCKSAVVGADKIDPRFRAADGSWVGVSGRARVLIVNSNLLTKDQYPKSVFDLGKPEWRGKVAMASTAEGSVVSWIAAMQKVAGTERTAELLKGLVANDVKVVKGHTEVRKAVATGEVAVGLVNHYYYFIQKKEDPASAVDIVYTDQGPDEVGVLVNVSGVGFVAGGKNAMPASDFASYLLTPESQKTYAEVNFEYPLVPGVPVAEGVLPFDKFKQMNVNLGDLDIDAALKLADAVGLK